FNPFVYLLQRSIKTVHEYIADEQTAAYERDALTYSSFLLNNAYGIQGSTIAHSFFNYNLLKKRIIMLNKNRSGRLARLKYLTALPLCAGMLCASTLAFAKDYGFIDLSPKTTKVDKPVMIKRLKIIDGKMTMYSDYITVKEKNGTKKRFEINTITPGDISYLLKEHKLRVTIIMVDSAKNRNNPMIVFPDTNDTIKPKLPPPPAPPTMKPSKVKMPPPAPPTMKQGKVKLPPPPPPVMEKPYKATSANKLLPPPPHDVVYTDLMKYVSKSTRYPTAARDKKVIGNVLVSLRLNDAHKLTDIKVINSIGSGCDEEVVRALKSYQETVSQTPGMYHLMVTFALTGENGEKSYYPKPVTSKIAGSKDFIGQVIVEGYVTDEAKQVQ
ncbi:MAG: BlaR1 peptidase, partial [Mucilaginibacter sp.]|nr:BlaR1 peptidase [Mucilaginibacter sp.]